MGTYDATISLTALVCTSPMKCHRVCWWPAGYHRFTAGTVQRHESSASDVTDAPVSRFMSAGEIAEQVQRAVASLLCTRPICRHPVRAFDFLVQYRGPRHSVLRMNVMGSSLLQRYRRARDNAHEGVYLDDFIIAPAERGEIVTGSNVVDTPFTTDLRPAFSTPADPTSGLVTGSYSVEIRDGSEYVRSIDSTQFRAFDSNERLSESVAITALGAAELRDGDTFTLSDGRAEVVFEFEQVELGNGVQPGRVPVPFTLEKSDLSSGFARPETAAEVARSIATAINRSDVQAVLQIPAMPAGGVDSTEGNRIDLVGDVSLKS